MNLITRKIEFDAGHRVYGHESKCAHLHGHRYVAEISVKSKHLDSIGRVVDFSVVKQLVGKWIDDNWDHNLLLNPEDPLLPYLDRSEQVTKPIFSSSLLGNPTAENMARYLVVQSVNLLREYPIEVHSVKLYETPNCWAIAHASD